MKREGVSALRPEWSWLKSGFGVRISDVNEIVLSFQSFHGRKEDPRVSRVSS